MSKRRIRPSVRAYKMEPSAQVEFLSVPARAFEQNAQSKNTGLRLTGFAESSAGDACQRAPRVLRFVVDLAVRLGLQPLAVWMAAKQGWATGD
jgi:hypothetical protein